MKTIIHQSFSKAEKNNIGFSITALAFGDESRISEMIENIKLKIQTDLISKGFFFVDSDRLDRIEDAPELISTIRLPSKILTKYRLSKDIKKCYYGFFSDVAALQDALRFLVQPMGDPIAAFSRAQLDSADEEARYRYSKQRLADITKQMFENDLYQPGSYDFMVSDLQLDFATEIVGQNEIKLKWKLAISNQALQAGDIQRFLELFRAWTVDFDAHFPKIFHSAYFAFGPTENPIQHEAIIKHSDLPLFGLDERAFLLGNEWGGYISNSVLHDEKDDVEKRLKEEAQVEPLSNGLIYFTNCDLTAYTREHREKMRDLLYEFLIPGVGVYQWNQYVDNDVRFSGYQDTICVFNGLWGYDIVFPFKIPIDDLKKHPNLSIQTLITTFQKKKS